MSVSYDVHVVDRGTDAFVPFVKAWYARARAYGSSAPRRGVRRPVTLCVFANHGCHACTQSYLSKGI